MPELNSVREFTALPNTKGVLTLAIFAKTKKLKFLRYFHEGVQRNI